MKKITLKNFWDKLPLMMAACILISCEKVENAIPEAVKVNTASDAKGSNTIIHYGEPKAVGAGLARTWVEVVKETGKPVAIGINFSARKQTIKSLPVEQTMYHLQFPEGIDIAPFKGMMFDWNPSGHIPMEMYGKEHFDFHFYMIPEEEHMTIPLEIGHAHSDEFERDYMPSDYMSLHLAIPGMGNHWISETAPEVTGEGFSKTLILGAYQNKQISIEPMITLAYLQSLKSNETVSDVISQFPLVQQAGYYPRKYTITYDVAAGEYKIALTELYYREAR